MTKHVRLKTLADRLEAEGRPDDACLVAQAAQYIETAHFALEDFRLTRLLMRKDRHAPAERPWTH